MAENKSKNAPAPEKQAPSNVVSLQAHKCTAEGCKHKPDRAGFCSEHYTWFKEGLITMEGYRAKDFDKKYHAYMNRKNRAA
ncbi:MAG: hypothetical protein KF681_14490 [Bdellovibrionaceae bacterium]|nr:hypothetical protein [Pseudobdellovibrionaceae bacterium]